MKPLARMVEVEWIDPHAVSDGGWTLPADVDHDPRPCKSMGYVLNECDATITIVASQAISDGDLSQVGDGMVLPRHAITRVTALGPADGVPDLARLGDYAHYSEPHTMAACPFGHEKAERS